MSKDRMSRRGKWVRSRIIADKTAIPSRRGLKLACGVIKTETTVSLPPIIAPLACLPARRTNPRRTVPDLPDPTSLKPSDLLCSRRYHRGQVTPNAEANRRVPYFRACIRSFGSPPEIMSDPTSGSTGPVPRSSVCHLSMPGTSGGTDGNQALAARAGRSPPSDKDVENTPSTPLQTPTHSVFANGKKTDEELVVLRRRKKGKPLENYHRKQNEV